MSTAVLGTSNVGPIMAKFLYELHAARAVAWAGYTILVWEFLLTIEEEVRYIWPARFSAVKFIFLTNRYGTLVYHTLVVLQLAGIWSAGSTQFCFRFIAFVSTVMFISFASIHILVLLRAWAIWGRRRRIAATLVAAFLVYAVASIVFVSYEIASARAHVPPRVPPLGVCITRIPHWLWCMWLPSILLDCGVFLLTIVSLRRRWQVEDISPLIHRLYRDGTIYFMFTLSSNVFNILTWRFYSAGPLNTLAVTFTLSLVNVAGQRLVLSLRKLDGGQPASTSFEMHELPAHHCSLPAAPCP